MKRPILCAAAALMLLTCGCSEPTYEGFVMPEQGASTLTPVSSYATGNRYAGIAPTEEQTEATFRSTDGLCVIDKKKSYYDVTLDLTQGDHYAAGKAYAETALLAVPDYEAFIDRYINELIGQTFRKTQNTGTGEAISRRIRDLTAALPADYMAELEGFAAPFHGGKTGFSNDGKLTDEEAMLLHLVPDVLRNTACSALTADGSRTASGKRLTARVLEWDLGRNNLMCSAHCVLHLKNGTSSLTSVTSLGLLDVITGINQDGVFAAVLDVGTMDVLYDSTGRESYTFAVREGLETCRTAKKFGDYIIRRAPSFPYSHNVFITDENDAFVAENCTAPEEGKPILRDENTKLCDGITWNTPGCLCAVNAYAADGNQSHFMQNAENIGRWVKYDNLFGNETQLTLSRMEELMTSEQTGTFLNNIRSEGVVFILLADYDTGTLTAALTGTEGVTDKPEFLNLGAF